MENRYICIKLSDLIDISGDSYLGKCEQEYIFLEWLKSRDIAAYYFTIPENKEDLK